MNRQQDHVAEKKEQLLEAIRSSSTFRRFSDISARMAENEEVKGRVDLFREKVYRAANAREPEDKLDEMQLLFEECREVRENPLAAEYLTAEMELCRMLQQICMDVMTVADLQIDSFMDNLDL